MRRWRRSPAPRTPDSTSGRQDLSLTSRREFTAQRDLLAELNEARVETGGRPVGIPALPDNAEVQAFPPQPSAFAEGSRALSEGSFGLIPDVAHDIEVFSNWGEHSGADQAGAVLDVAGSLPFPGAKPLTEALERGLDTVTGAARHVDDLPTGSRHHTPDAPSDTPGAPHSGADAGPVVQFGVEDTAALLNASEANGGHLIASHVDQSPADLAARLEAHPRFKVISLFANEDEAIAAVGTALQQNRRAVEDWIANGALRKLELDARFSGGTVLERGSIDAVTGTGVRVVLKGDGTGGWYVLTGFPTP